MLSLAEARALVLAAAEPTEPIEVPLSEALGLVLAEPALADVDMPPFDLAAAEGYALRAADGSSGAVLRVVGQGRGSDAASGGDWLEVGPEETARLRAGDPMPPGTDAIAVADETRAEPAAGPPHVVALLRPIERGHLVVRRGSFLRAGTEIAPAGTRLRLPMVGLLAAQGCIHPVCYRRVRVAVLAVGDHLVRPGDAPVLHRERNAASATVIAPCLHWGATAHDLGTIAERDGVLDAALARALTAPVLVVLGHGSGRLTKALARAGVEPVFAGVALEPGERLGYSVVRGDSGRVQSHVFLVPLSPTVALIAVTLLVGPLIARLQGSTADGATTHHAVWSGTHPPTGDRLWPVPVTLATDDAGRLCAVPVEHRGRDDLPAFARAEALALLPPRSGPWQGGERVAITALDACPAIPHL
jgi:molybdopterin biosynthesis enzyme